LCRIFPRVWHGPKQKNKSQLIFTKTTDSSVLTNSLLSTVFTTISSGAYWLTSKRNFNTLLSPSSCIKGDEMSATVLFECGFDNAALLDDVVLLEIEIKTDLLIKEFIEIRPNE
jgi:hypothetical protein